MEPQPVAEATPSPEVDLAKAALDAAQSVAVNTVQTTTSNAISNQDVAWFNQGVQLIDDKKYKEALSCFDRALPAFAGDDAMIIRILNNRGNAYYFWRTIQSASNPTIKRCLSGRQKYAVKPCTTWEQPTQKWNATTTRSSALSKPCREG